jgi:hypothetical protein
VIEQLASRGYGYGSGVISPGQDRFLVNIPKNASSYMLDWANRHGWSSVVIEPTSIWSNNITEIIVCVRDPVQRWISGVGQYLTSYVLNVTGAYSWETGPGPNDQQISGDDFIADYNQVVERLLFDNLARLDDHVWPQVEFFENTAAATMSTAFAAADVQPYNDRNATANTAVATGAPLNLSTGTSGFATAAVTEGTVAGYRLIDMQMIAPTNQYVYQSALGDEFDVTPQNYVRVRVTFAASVNMYIWILFGPEYYLTLVYATNSILDLGIA